MPALLGSRSPRVLAFVRAWSIDHADRAELRAIRAELRGLGASLTIVSDGGTWSFRPDDDAERTTAAVYPDHLEVPRDRDALFVLDADDHVRFSYDAGGSLAGTLGEALAAAGAAIAAKPRPTMYTRREWTLTCLVAGFALAVFPGCKPRARSRARAKEAHVPPPPSMTTTELDVNLRVNGEPRALRLDARASLLDTLRERLGLTGTKKGCDMGQCGACTVLVGGRRVLSCLTLAALADGQDVTTIEGLARGDQLHPLQQAFVAHDALQCGYCTPGQIMSAAGLLAEGHATTDDDLREQMSGNLCRCGAYPNIVAAIRSVKGGA